MDGWMARKVKWIVLCCVMPSAFYRTEEGKGREGNESESEMDAIQARY